jgi:membrane protease YdiL (CAAX protease family)/LysM repeat protein
MILALIYLTLITLAELLTATIGAGADFVRVGLSLHSLILVVLILHGASTRRIQTRRLLLTLALAPLIRILSISLPLQKLPLIDWYLIIGALLYLAAFVTAHITGISTQRMGLTWRGWPIQIVIALIGFGLGLMEFTILGSRPLIESLSWGTFLFPAFVLMIFTGFLEELIFRGLVQNVSTMMMGRFGIWYGALLFAVLHIGYLSIWDVVFVFGVGLLFGYLVQKTHSLLGVSLAHGFTNISMYLIYPFIMVGGFFPFQPMRPSQEITLPATATPLPRQTLALILFVTPTPTPQATLPVLPFPESTPTPTPTPSLIPLVTAIPAATCVVPSGWVVYTVRSGDTLFAISQMFRVTVSELKNANCLTTTVIHVGQRLYVPYVPTSTPFFATETATPNPTLVPETDTPVPTLTNTPLPTDTDTPLPPTPTELPTVSDMPGP